MEDLQILFGHTLPTVLFGGTSCGNLHRTKHGGIMHYALER
jgi:hypothetical protein